MGNNSCFEVLALCYFDECIDVFGSDNNSHSLLRFGDGELCAVETVVFLGNCVEVDLKTVCKLAYCNGNAARAEVVAALYHAGSFGVSEQTLKLALFGGVALLDRRR